MFGFQKLEIYHLAKEIVKYNYTLTKGFPDEERFALAQQMNRAAVSVPSNIAEGVSRRTIKDKLHFISISYGSLMELTCQMEIAHELGYIDKEKYSSYLALARNLSVKLSNYKNALDKKDN